jgi:regulatory protein
MGRRTSSSTAGDGVRRQSPAPASLDSKQAFALALRWIAARDLTEAQIRDRLTRRGTGQPIVNAVLARLAEDRVVDDRRVAQTVARAARDVKRHGPCRVARDLESRGVAREVVRDVVAETFADADADQLVERALARRLRGPIDTPNEYRRLSRYLARQGFPPDSIVRALDPHDRRR